MRRAACLLLLAVFGVGLTHAQDEAKSPAPVTKSATVHRFLYLVQNGAAKDLATALSAHFKGDASVSVVAEPNANALLVAAPSGASEEIMKMLEQLDRRPRRVQIDVLIAEVPFDEKAEPANAADFSGPADAVFTKAESLARKAKNGQTRRFRVSSLENQRASVTIGASQPVVTGVAGLGGGRGGFGGGGGAGAGAVETKSITYRDVGTTFSATPRVGADNAVTLELQLDEARIHTPENGVQIAAGTTASEFTKAMFTGKVSVASGEAVLAQGVKSDGPATKTQSLVIVSAKILDK